MFTSIYLRVFAFSRWPIRCWHFFLVWFYFIRAWVACLLACVGVCIYFFSASVYLNILCECVPFLFILYFVQVVQKKIGFIYFRMYSDMRGKCFFLVCKKKHFLTARFTIFRMPIKYCGHFVKCVEQWLGDIFLI